MDATDKAPRPQPQWIDLALYLLVGAGSFIVLSSIAGFRITVVSLPVTILAFALNLICFAGSVYLVGVRRGRLSLSELGFYPPRLDSYWLVGAAALSLALIPLRGFVGFAAQQLSGQDLSGLRMRFDLIAPDGFGWLPFAVTLIGAGILVPIAEELFFRGAIYTWFRDRFNIPIALLVSSTLFALGHVDSPGVIASSFVLGVANAWIFEKSKTLWAPIVMHIVSNSFAVLLVYAALAIAPDLMQP